MQRFLLFNFVSEYLRKNALGIIAFIAINRVGTTIFLTNIPADDITISKNYLQCCIYCAIMRNISLKGKYGNTFLMNN